MRSQLFNTKNEVIVPLSVFEIPYRKKIQYLTLNVWILISRSKYGSGMGNKYKHQVQAKLKPYVLSAMEDGAVIEPMTQFTFEWTFRNNRIDLDNWAFVHKFIFDCFQESVLNDEQVFMPNDNLTYVQGLHDVYKGVDKRNPHVRITWSSHE